MSTFLIVAGWFVTLLGWFVTGHQANIREERKETRAEIDALIKTIEKLQESAYAYYKAECDKRDEVRITILSLISRLDSRIELIEQYEYPPPIREKFSILFEAVTDGDFDSAHLQPLNSKDSRFIRISSAVDELILILDRWFINKYRRNCPSELRRAN